MFVLLQILSSQDGTSFSDVFINSPKFAHPLLRILIAREVRGILMVLVTQ